jgi:hypothetical protein
MTTVRLEARNATLGDLAQILTDQNAAKVDIVTPIVNLRFRGGIATLAGTAVFDEGQRYRPTDIADGQLADKLGVPHAYLRKLRAERVDLYDANVNGWIHGGLMDRPAPEDPVEVPADGRIVKVRTFQGDPGQVGVMRAVLSDKHPNLDNFDGLLACLEGVKEAGIPVEVLGCNLSETRMVVKVAAPDVIVNAPGFLENYRSPFKGKNLPQWVQDKFKVNPDGIMAGFVFSNSETGGGAWNLAPFISVLACLNGMVIQKGALRHVHVGAQLEQGIVQWSEDTETKALELITARTRDTVQAFLTEDFVSEQVDEITGKAARPIENPEEAITMVAGKLGFNEDQRKGILGHFIAGGQLTAGGVMNAVTSYAQVVENPDASYEMERSALKVLDLVA